MYFFQVNILIIRKMLKTVIYQICRHKSLSTSKNNVNCIKTINSYRITLSDSKTRYVSFNLNTYYTLFQTRRHGL